MEIARYSRVGTRSLHAVRPPALTYPDPHTDSPLIARRSRLPTVGKITIQILLIFRPSLLSLHRLFIPFPVPPAFYNRHVCPPLFRSYSFPIKLIKPIKYLLSDVRAMLWVSLRLARVLFDWFCYQTFCTSKLAPISSNVQHPYASHDR